MPDKDYKKFAAETLAKVYETQDYERILKALGEKESAFQDIPPEKFGLEFLGMRLALMSHSWARSCRENKVTEPGVENLFFKTVMYSFQSPKFKDIAAVYSEYLHAPEAEEKSLISVTALMMRRLDLGQKMGSREKPKLSEGFKTLVEIGESLRSTAENEFFHFCYSS